MKDFTQGNIFKQVILFSIPLIFANMLMTMSNLINLIWIGKLLGPDAVAAITSAMGILMLFPSFMIGLSTASSIMVSQAYGAKNEPLLKKILANSFMTIAIFCIIISILGILLTDPLLKIMGTPESSRPYASVMLKIMCAGMIFQFFFNWMSGILRGVGDAKSPLFFMLLATILNIILVPLLITGIGPFPKWGIAGAACATVISNALASMVGYFYIARKNQLFNVFNWVFKFDGALVGKIFSIGIPSSLQMLITSLSGVIIISLVNHFGRDVAAAYGIAMQIDMLSFMPAMTIGIAVTAMVGQNLGAGLYHRIRKITTYAIIFSVILASVLCAVIMLFSSSIGSLFLSSGGDRDAILHYLKDYYIYIGFTYITFAIIFALQGVARAAGATIVMLVLTATSIIVIRVPLAYYLSLYTPMKQQGIWLAMLLSTILGVLLNYVYYASGRWKKKKIFHVAPVAVPELE